MKILETSIPDCVVVEPKVHADDRGFVYELFNDDTSGDRFGSSFVQCNVSRSRRDVVRGIHYQWPKLQGKLVSVVEGEVWDVAVDIRVGSPTFGRWAAAVLSAGNRRSLWIPEGFAHGFAVLSEHATVSYMCTKTYDRDGDRAIRWDDARLAIDWPIANPILSAKDHSAPGLDDVTAQELPRFGG